MTFNTDSTLWENYLKAFPERKLSIRDGAIWNSIDGIIGLFENSEKALMTLQKAGYSKSLIQHES